MNFDDAEITVEFAPAKLWPGQKPERVVELVNDRVRGATNHTFGVKPRRDVTRDKLRRVVIPSTGCDCKACCLAAYEAVANVDGVYQTTAAACEYSGAPFTAELQTSTACTRRRRVSKTAA